MAVSCTDLKSFGSLSLFPVTILDCQHHENNKSINDVLVRVSFLRLAELRDRHRK